MIKKVLTLAKNLNSFSIDDVLMMTGLELSDAKNILEELIKSGVLKRISEREFHFSGLESQRKLDFKLIEKRNYKTVYDDINFIEASKYFFENYVAKNCSVATSKWYKSIFNSHLIPYFKRVNIRKISQENLKEFMNIKIKEGLSSKRINDCMTTLGNILNRFEEWNYIEKSPYNGIINIKRKKESKIQILSDLEVEELLLILKSDYPLIYLPVRIAIESGLKKNEI